MNPQLFINSLWEKFYKSEDCNLINNCKDKIYDAAEELQRASAESYNNPSFWLTLGKLNFWLGEYDEMVKNYCRAIAVTKESVSLWIEEYETTKKVMSKLKDNNPIIGTLQSVYKLLLLALEISDKGKSYRDDIKSLRSSVSQKYDRSTVIIAGGTAEAVSDTIHVFSKNLKTAFDKKKRIAISGGTTSGIAGIVGDLSKEISSLTTIGYVPTIGIDCKEEDIHCGYNEIVQTTGEKYSYLEPLQYWIDIIADGVDPSEVKILGINGGRISYIEYLLGAALGAQVGCIEGSGRSADEIFLDPINLNHYHLQKLIDNEETIVSFIHK